MDQTSLETKVVTTATDLIHFKCAATMTKKNFCYISLLSGQGGRIWHNCTVAIFPLINPKWFYLKITTSQFKLCLVLKASFHLEGEAILGEYLKGKIQNFSYCVPQLGKNIKNLVLSI